MGSLSEHNPSLWVGTCGPDRDRPAVTGEIKADVAVVGGGITGLTTAARLTEAGVKVVLVEAGRLASGVTGYTTAKVTALHGAVYSKLENGAGPERAAAYAAANQAGLATVGDLVARHELDCEWESATAFTYTSDPAYETKIEAEVSAAQRAGLAATLTTETELPFEVAAAVRLDDQAQFHPRKFCLGLAAAIEGQGARIFECSRVADVKDGSPVTVVCEGGTVEADWVVLATHIPFLDRGLFFAKAFPERSYALAWKQQESGGDRIEGMYISIDQPTRSIRSTMGGDLIIGGEGHKPGTEPNTPARYEAVESWAREHFGPGEVTYRWSAQDYGAVDGLPFVGRQLPGSRVLVATGFAKWGMTNGAASASILSDLILEQENPWSDAFSSTRMGPAITSADFYKANFDAVGRHLIGDRLKTLRPPAASSLAAGEGGICELDGEKVAAFRDEDGKIHAVSPVCTHVGCLVAFNPAERSWDCPCHGSRYTVEGKVIQGPAVRDLEPKASPDAT